MEKIWLQSYEPGVAADINPDQYSSVYDLLSASLTKFANNKAFENLGKYMTYRELELYSQYLAAYMQNVLGLQKGDRVALMMPNILQYPIALLACLRAGFVIVNINPLYTARELKLQLSDSGAETIIILEYFAHTLAEVYQETKLKNIIITSMGDMLGLARGFAINTILRHIKRAIKPWNIPNTIQWLDVLKQGKTCDLQHTEINNTDIAFLQYTGGTTGIAKGAILTHRNIIANILQAKEWINQYAEPGKEIIITALPLYHIFSLTANCLLFMLFGGLNVLITNPRDIKAMVRHIKKFKITAFTGVNTLFNALNNYKPFLKLDFSKFKLVLSGGMPLQEAVATRWHELTNLVLLEAYGLTETSPAVSINPISEPKYNGTVGLPVSSTEVKIIDEDENELGVDEVGELVVKGPQVMREYWQKAEETQSAFTQDGWFKTGDIASINSKGYITIIDRKKDMIIVSGFNVYPTEVENVALQFPDIADAAVLGFADPKTGEGVKLCIVTNKDIDLAALKAYLKANLTNYKRPTVIEVYDELPKSAMGKVLRRELRTQRLQKIKQHDS
jgi:long-chain acyl-CoA synthetase